MPLSAGTRLGHSQETVPLWDSFWPEQMRFKRIGRYDVTALIGVWQVWEATDTQLNRDVELYREAAPELRGSRDTGAPPTAVSEASLPTSRLSRSRIRTIRRAALHEVLEEDQMSDRTLVVVLTVVAIVSLSAGRDAQAQTAPADDWTPPRTSWGVPDLLGIWDYQSQTPLERPSELADRAFFTEEQAAEVERQALERNSVDRRDGGAARDLARAYGEIWYIRNPVRNTRTSLVVEPPDGRVPPLTPEAERRQATRAERRRSNPPDSPSSWTGLRTYARCISRAMPRLPQGYNSGTLILQTPGWVVLRYEQLDTRFIPIDGRPHVHKNIQQWNGDSRGYWDGDTLVVETKNFTGKQMFRGIPKGTLHLTERFTRVDADTMNYEATLTDPTTWSRPWTYLLPWQKDDDYVIYEYACHERNYSMTNILRGARAQEQEGATSRVFI